MRLGPTLESVRQRRGWPIRIRAHATLFGLVPPLADADGIDSRIPGARNSQYMVGECPFSCGVCLVNFKAACQRHASEQPAAVGGTIDETFHRALTLPEYAAYKPRVLHREPWIVAFDEFLRPDEADRLLAVAGHKFERSLAGDGVTPVRTSSTSWCNVPHCMDHPLFQTVRDRISNLTRVPWKNAEHLQVLRHAIRAGPVLQGAPELPKPSPNPPHTLPTPSLINYLQVLRYEPGQFYKEHHDQNSPRYSAWGPRLYTFFMYLNDVEAGGETRFTKLNIVRAEAARCHTLTPPSPQIPASSALEPS